jgi:hypothetical protein
MSKSSKQKSDHDRGTEMADWKSFRKGETITKAEDRAKFNEGVRLEDIDALKEDSKRIKDQVISYIKNSDDILIRSHADEAISIVETYYKGEWVKSVIDDEIIQQKFIAEILIFILNKLRDIIIPTEGMINEKTKITLFSKIYEWNCWWKKIKQEDPKEQKNL